MGFKGKEGYSISHSELLIVCFHVLVNIKCMTSELVFMLQMDAEAEDKMLWTYSEGMDGELAHRFPDALPTIL